MILRLQIYVHKWTNKKGYTQKGEGEGEKEEEEEEDLWVNQGKP